MKRLNINTSIESFLVMILMIVFAISTMFIIMEGKSAFERVTENKIEDENARIALSYVNKRIKQDDRAMSVQVIDNALEELTALKIEHEDGFSTYIFYYNGIMYECYTDEAPSLELSTEIVQVKGLSFVQKESQIITHLKYEYQGIVIPIKQITTLRAKGGNYE